MEPEVIAFLKKISNTLGVFLLTLIANVLVGIYWGWAFVYNNKVVLGNIIYYCFAIISTIVAIYFITKMWRNYKSPQE